MLNNTKNTGVIFLRAALLLAALPTGQAIAAQEASRNNDAKQLYQKLCSVCHGDKGNGDSRAAGSFNPPPRDFTAAESTRELSRDRMIQSVANGRPGTAMVGHAKKLSPKQIERLVDYIRVTFMNLPLGAHEPSTLDQRTVIPTTSVIPAAPPTSNLSASGVTNAPLPAIDMTLPLPQKLKGNLESGRTLFMNNCFTCHGIKGDGNGPRAYFIAPRPRDFTSEESRQTYNRPRLFDAISNGKRGTVMPAWDKVLDKQQIANLAEFVFQEYVKGSYPLSNPLIQGSKKKAH